jgi:tetraacyldisaccharide 4'-kinase
MMRDTPSFWWKKTHWKALALWPLSQIYGFIAAYRMNKACPPSVSVPVICVGNFTVGGGGKTPTVVMLAQTARDMGLNPGILSRGYGGLCQGVHCVNVEHDSAELVGDEPLLMAHYAPVVVCVDRHKGALLLQKQGCDLIIMDDGFQSMRLKTDFNLILIDARRGIGNGYVFPSGPLRAPMIPQLRLCHGIVKTGRGTGADVVLAPQKSMPIYHARTVPDPHLNLSNKRVLAFAAIADPEKFFTTLLAMGATLSLKRTWADHYFFTDDDLHDLLTIAQTRDLILVTTEKDAMRLRRESAIAQKLLEQTVIVRVTMCFDPSDAPRAIIDQALHNFQIREKGVSRAQSVAL